MKLVAGWAVAGALSIAVGANFEEVRTALGMKFDASDFGMSVDPAAAPRVTVENVPTRRASERGVEVRANRNGHYEMRAHVNGRPIEVMLDTGATFVALTWEDARAAGVHVRDADFRHTVSTANGTARVASVMLESISIQDITVRDVRAVVAEPGRLETTLLGMSFLSRLGKAEMRRGVLVLEE